MGVSLTGEAPGATEMRGKDYFAALPDHRVCGLTAALRQGQLQIGAQYRIGAIRRLGPTVFERNIERFSWRGRIYQLGLAEAAVLGHVGQQQ